MLRTELLTRSLDPPSSAPSSWDRPDLVRRLGLALNIARRTVEHLGESGYHDDDAAAGSFGPDKPLAETAMLLYVAQGVAGLAGEERRVQELARLLAPLARSQRTAVALALHPSICLQLAMPHILLSQLGQPDPHFDSLLALSIGSMAHRGREVVPHRTLEAMWLRSLWSHTPPGPEFDEAAASSVMNHSLDLLWGCREDAYAHTHTFMYFTDFGHAPRAWPRPRSQMLEESSGLLARSFLLEDFDLAAEVLMAWPFTGAPWSAAASFGFRVLAQLEDRVGYLPAGNGVPEKFNHLQGNERTRYALAASYHTAYVMGMLCALALRPQSAPPQRVTGPLVTASLIDELLAMIPVADTPWQHTWRSLPSLEQRALGPFLLDMALLTQVRSHGYAAAGQLLRMAATHGIAYTPVCAQTAELLERISLCAESR